MAAAPTITHDPAAHCFECVVEGQRCVAEYHLRGRVLHVTHTAVPPALQGRGIAAALVEAVLAHARGEGLHIEPDCSYVRAYLQRHPAG
jgi:predicted GNAT family acetyltransferase